MFWYEIMRELLLWQDFLAVLFSVVQDLLLGGSQDENVSVLVEIVIMCDLFRLCGFQ